MLVPSQAGADGCELAAYVRTMNLHQQEYDGLEDAMQRFARTDIGGGAAPEDARGELGCAQKDGCCHVSGLSHSSHATGVCAHRA